MPKTKSPDWLKKSYKNIWLPYTQMKLADTPLPVRSVKGCKIRLENGSSLVDGISSWWSACHGYRHPHIEKAVIHQMKRMPHIMFGGLSHKRGYKLATKLVNITPEGLDRVFFSDSGSTAVEVAMKMATQYWSNKGDTRRNKFICFRGGYHGDTMGCMSLADPDDGMHKAFNDFMPKQYTLSIPRDEYDLAEFTEMIEGIAPTAAALIIEPLVQCAGGMIFHSPDILAEIYKLCKANDILFIADEVATGFGRTGLMFACDEAGITPDIMCIGKALTGGTVGLAATLATEDIFNAFMDDSLDKAFMHGPTFMANPLACAAANASLELFENEPRLEQVEQIELQLLEELDSCKNLDLVKDVRVKGAIGVVQLHEITFNNLLKLRRQFIEMGVWLRPIEDVIYIMPAFTISEKELRKLTKAICKALL